MTIGKQQFWVAVGLPEEAQHVKGGVGQGNQPGAVVFRVTNVNAVAHCVNVGQFQVQTFAQA